MSEFDLLELEPLKPLSVSELGERSRPRPTTPEKRRPQTAHDAHAALRRVEGAERAIERVPGLGMPEVWGEVAYFGVNEHRGHVAYETFIWDADFPAVGFTVENAYQNGLVYFEREMEGFTPPGETGQVWCYFYAPETGYYALRPIVHRPDLSVPAGYPDFSVVEFLIDEHSFGQFQFKPGPFEPLLIANLAASGDAYVAHRFTIKQVQSAFLFHSVTVWNIPAIEASP
jgi:hypothetical protein